MSSRRCQQLLARERDLRQLFVVATRLSPAYTRQELDRLRAYRLLVHAEIESYLEDRARWAAQRAVARFAAGRPTQALAGLFAYEDRPSQELPRGIDVGTHALLTRAHKALIRYEYGVGRNNGIKEENLLSLLLPIGCREPDLDSLWVTEMTQFGTDRGSVAHSAVKTQQPMDPDTEVKRVQRLVAGLLDLDLLITSLVR